MLVRNVAWMIRLRGSIDPYAYLIRNGFTNQEALGILNKESDGMVLEEMGRLTSLLDCTLNDLFDWIGDAESHLAKLKKPSMDELEKMLETCSPDEILAIVRGVEK